MSSFNPCAPAFIPARDFNARRVLFDTNILLDAMDPTRGQFEEARAALAYCNGGGDMGMATPGSLKDAYYILSKRYDAAYARMSVDRLLDLLFVLPFDAEVCIIAAQSNEPDFEDGMVRAAAELNEVEFILTRDKAAFQNSKIRSIDCAEYLRIVHAENPRP